MNLKAERVLTWCVIKAKTEYVTREFYRKAKVIREFVKQFEALYITPETYVTRELILLLFLENLRIFLKRTQEES